MVRSICLLLLAALSGCSTTQYSYLSGKSPSDKSGDNEFPLIILSVNGIPVTETKIRLEKGAFVVTAVPDNPWVRGKVSKRSWHISIAHCTQYSYVARFADPNVPDWEPVLVESKEIRGCMEKMAAAIK